LMPGAQVVEQFCPLFVPLVENGFTDADDDVVRLVVERYLRPIKGEDVDTLILGCTHYPMLAEAIGRYMGDSVVLVDSGAATARYACELLTKHDLRCEPREQCRHRFYVSDRTEGFSSIAGIFLGEDISGDVVRVDIDSL